MPQRSARFLVCLLLFFLDQTWQNAASPSLAQTAMVMRLEPMVVVVGPLEEFALQLVVETGSQPIDGAQAAITFDPQYLEVLEIEPSGALPTVLDQYFDNEAGIIRFAAGILQGTLPSGRIVLLTIHFLSWLPTSGTPVNFASEESYPCKVTHAGQTLALNLEPSAVVVAEDAPTPTATQPVVATPTPSSATPTPSHTATHSPEPSATHTSTATEQPSFTPSPTSTELAPTNTPPPTASLTETPLPSPTASRAPYPLPTLTGVASPSPEPASATPSPSPTSSPTWTPTASVALRESPPARSPAVTDTPPPQASISPSATLTMTPPLPSATAQPSAQPSPAVETAAPSSTWTVAPQPATATEPPPTPVTAESPPRKRPDPWSLVAIALIAAGALGFAAFRRRFLSE